MNEVYPEWLSKEMVVGVNGLNLDAYLLALEGWRRGLSLKWYYDVSSRSDLKITGPNPTGKIISLSNHEDKHYFYRSRGDKVTPEVVDIGMNHQEIIMILKNAGVSVPKGKSFDESAAIDEIMVAGTKVGFPLVIKPTFGSSGENVITNIQSGEQLAEAIDHVRIELDHPNITIEQHYNGDDLRIYVAGDRVLGAVRRKPGSILGNGESNIEQLISEKNEKRKAIPHLATNPITIDHELIKYLNVQNYTVQSVPKANERIYLNSKSKISSGGESVDITDTLDAEVQTLAIKALQAIPGLHHAGIDIIVGEEGAFVIDINHTAGIGIHVFPSEGKPRNIPEGIIDYYFPETIGLACDRTKVYFDYKKIQGLLLNREVKEVEISDAPKGMLHAKRYVISGKAQQVGYRNWVHKQALEQELNGYVRNLRNGKVVVVVGSEDEGRVNMFKDIFYEGPGRANVGDIQEYDWDKRVKVGFEIKAKK